jgi:hypothetical protein
MGDVLIFSRMGVCCPLLFLLLSACDLLHCCILAWWDLFLLSCFCSFYHLDCMYV